MLSQTLKEMYAYFSLWYLLYKNCLSTTVTGLEFLMVHVCYLV